ncbi:MAG: T9SS type A sorting domain-containing protein [Cyclobacteriaceae bacterium]
MQGLVNIYPNPTANGINIVCPQPASVIVYNSQGKLLLEKTVNSGSEYRLSLTFLPSGVYQVVILTESGFIYRTSLLKK